MSRKISDGDTTAGNDLTDSYTVPATNSTSENVSWSSTQISDWVESDQNLAKIRADIEFILQELAVQPPSVSNTAFFSASTNDNSLIYLVTITTNFAGDRVSIGTGTDPAPSGDDGIAATFIANTPAFFLSPTYMDNLSAYSTTTGVIAYVRNTSTGVWIQATPTVDNGSGGFDIQATATEAPTITTIGTIAKGATDPTVDIDYTAPVASTIDSADLIVDLVQVLAGGGYAILVGDITQGASATYTHATAGATLNCAFLVTVAGDDSRQTQTPATATSISLDSPVSITLLTLSSVANDDATVQVDAITASAAADECFYRWDDTTTPNPDDTGGDSSGWVTVLAVSDTIEAPSSSGTFTLSIWVRDATYPNSISARYDEEVTIASDSATAVYGWNALTKTVSNEGNAEYTLYIDREGSTTGDEEVSIKRVLTGNKDAVPAGSTGNVSGDYQTITQTITMPDGEAQVGVTLSTLWTDLAPGDYRTLAIEIWEVPTGTGTIDANRDTMTIKIIGTEGWWASGDMDLNNVVESDLTDTLPIRILDDDTVRSYDSIVIDADDRLTSLYHGLEVSTTGTTTKAGNVTVSNALIKNAKWNAVYLGSPDTVTLRNCKFVNWGTLTDPTQDSKGTAIRSDDNKRGTATAGCDNISVLGCYAEGINGMFVHWYGNMDTGIYEENRFECTGGTGRAFGNLFAETPNEIIRHNVIRSKHDHSLDAIDWIGKGASSGNIAYCEANFLWGIGGPSHTGSAFGILFEDFGFYSAVDTYGYTTIQHNTLRTPAGNGGMNYTCGWNLTVRQNDVYMPTPYPVTDFDGSTDHSIGIGCRQFETGNEIVYGAFYNFTLQENNVLYYGHYPINDDTSYFISTAGHGSVATGMNQPITGWSTSNTNSTMTSEWANGSGEALVDERKIVLNNPAPAFDDGIDVLFHVGCPVGNGVLSFVYNGGTSYFLFRAFGENDGNAVQEDASPVSGWGEWYSVYSSGGGHIRIRCDASQFPTADTYYNVRCTQHGIWDKHNYPGTTGIRTGTDELSITGSAPATPANPTAASASATSVSLDADTVGGVDGYRWYRDNVLIADVTDPAYTDTGSDLEGGALVTDTSYSYEITAYTLDGAIKLESARSSPVSAAPTNASNLVTQGGFDTDAADRTAFLAAYSNWGASTNAVITVSGGSLTVTNGDGSAAWVTFTGTGSLTSGHTVQVQADVPTHTTTNGAYIDVDSASSGNAWGTGDMWYGTVKDTNSPFEITSSASTTNNLYVTLNVNGATAGKGFTMSYFRIIEN